METKEKKSKKKLEKPGIKQVSLGSKDEVSRIPTRGRIFEGYVTKKFPDRVVLEFERTVYLNKYERFMKKKTRIHAKLPKEISVEVGDLIRARECRPLSKIIHFIVVDKVRSKDEVKS